MHCFVYSLYILYIIYILTLFYIIIDILSTDYLIFQKGVKYIIWFMKGVNKICNNYPVFCDICIILKETLQSILQYMSSVF